jgi:hypothetical protein
MDLSASAGLFSLVIRSHMKISKRDYVPRTRTNVVVAYFSKRGSALRGANRLRPPDDVPIS